MLALAAMFIYSSVIIPLSILSSMVNRNFASPASILNSVDVSSPMSYRLHLE